jgi:LPS-assembly lipoprotein
MADGVAVFDLKANAVTTEILSVSDRARANEYSIRHHVEFGVEDAAGTVLLPKQTIELSREFTFDRNQSLGVAQEQEQLTKDMERDMVQAILRRIEATARHRD